MVKVPSKGLKDSMYRLQLALGNANTEFMSDSIGRKLIDMLAVKPTDPKVTREGKPIHRNGADHTDAMNRFIGWYDMEGQFNWPQRSFAAKVAERISDDVLKKAFPNNKNGDYDDIVYPDVIPGPLGQVELVFDMDDEGPIEGATKFFVEIRPKSGRWSLWPVIYPCKVHGEIDEDQIPDEIIPLLEDAHIVFASAIV